MSMEINSNFNIYKLLNSVDVKDILKNDPEMTQKLKNVMTEILKNKDQLSEANFTLLKGFLDAGIEQIEADTTGNASWLRYVGHKEAYTELTSRGEFLKTVKSAVKTIEERKAAPTDLAPNLPPEAGGPPTDLPPVAPRTGRAPAAIPQPALQNLDSQTKVEPKSSPNEAAKVATPAAESKPQLEGETPMKKVGGGPPPPPSAGAPRVPGGGPPPPAPAKPKKFAGEMDAPTFKPSEYMKLTNDEASAEIKVIESYVKSTKKVLDDVRASFEEVTKTESQFNEKNQELKEIAARVVAGGANLETLKSVPKDEIAYLSMPNKSAGSSEQIPFFPDAQFEQLKVVKKDLPESLRKETAIQTVGSELKQAESELKVKKQEVDDLRTKINELKSKDNNGIKFSEFEKLINDKTNALKIWENGMKNREKKISGAIKEKAAPALKEAVQEPVKEMLPGEEIFSILSQAAQILLVGADKNQSDFFSKLTS